MKYPILRKKPVAFFLYKGNHSHAVKRTVLLIEANKHYLKGYELREGSLVRKFSKAPIKSYLKEKIAKKENLRKESRKGKGSTLIRNSLLNIIISGV
jgi:hypothetical protein